MMEHIYATQELKGMMGLKGHGPVPVGTLGTSINVGDIPDGFESELCNMLVECCSQERTYLRYYGLIGQRFWDAVGAGAVGLHPELVLQHEMLQLDRPGVRLRRLCALGPPLRLGQHARLPPCLRHGNHDERAAYTKTD